MAGMDALYERDYGYHSGAVMMGNHEDYSLDWKMAKPDRYLAHFHLPNNGDADYKTFLLFDWEMYILPYWIHSLMN